MTILFIYPLHTYIGGVEIAILNVIKELYKDNKIIVGYTNTSTDDRMLDMYKPYAEVKKLDDAIEVDLAVYCSMWSYKGIPNIKARERWLWVHGIFNTNFNTALNHSRFDKIICVSEAVKKSMLIFYKVPNEIIHVIHNFQDVEGIINKSKEPYDLKKADLNLITVARISEEKGFGRMEVMIKALKEKNVNFKWFIVGQGVNKIYEEKVKQKLGQYKEVEFLGVQQNPYKIIRQCDYGVLLSNVESWGLFITECKILGKPVIATDFDAAEEQVPGYGLIVPFESDYLDVVDKIKPIEIDFKWVNPIDKWVDLMEGVKK